jgi:hypothetical protein
VSEGVDQNTSPESALQSELHYGQTYNWALGSAGLLAGLPEEDLSLCAQVWNGVPSICLLIRIW